MGKIHKPRAGSLQFWPRKRTERILPSVNWKPLEKKYSKPSLLGFICYKAGNARILAQDLTLDSMTKGKQIILPCTILEIPPSKILSIRFYKNNNLVTEILSDNLDKELKHKIKLPKTKGVNKIEDIEKNLKNFDNIRFLIYSLVKKTEKKKTPDMAEIALSGTLEEKFNLAKSLLGKEINFADFFTTNQVVDVHGVTKGYGFSGPVHRHGIALKPHKTEKGIRRPGSLGPWHPSRTTFHAPMAGQLGFFKRTHYNQKILDIGKSEKLALEFKNYGKVKTNYLAIIGSVQGPAKRQVLLTNPLRETKKTLKRNYEIVKILN
jgi:large subunit ribosomal protein L3